MFERRFRFFTIEVMFHVFHCLAIKQKYTPKYRIKKTKSIMT